MNSVPTHKKFIFNNKIDQTWLHSLYEYDYSYIAEVFNSSLDTLKEESPAFAAAFEANDMSALKKVAHKLKPVFGFSGLLDHQDQLANFENACRNSPTINNITVQYIETVNAIKEGKDIIQEDYNRLTAFISA